MSRPQDGFDCYPQDDDGDAYEARCQELRQQEIEQAFRNFERAREEYWQAMDDKNYGPLWPKHRP